MALPALGGAGARLQGISKVLKSVVARDIVLLGLNYWSMYLSILGDQSFDFQLTVGFASCVHLPSFGFGSITSLLYLFVGLTLLLFQVDWASGIAL